MKTIPIYRNAHLGFSPKGFLRNGLQPLLSDEREQLERGAARVFLAALPLADEPGGDVKIAREYRLARLLTHADLPDLFGRKVLDWRQAYLVEFLHRLLTNDARLIKANRGLMHSGQRVAAILFTHGIQSP